MPAEKPSADRAASAPAPAGDAAPDPVAAAKHAARVRAREARAGLEPAVCRAHASALASALLALPELAGARTVLAYASLPAELDPARTVSALRLRGVAVAYPRIESPGTLGLHLVAHEVELIAGPFGLAQPSEHAPRAPHDSIDAVIVPGVAFDECGRRLGYGGGYYDRLLPALRSDCVRIGVAYDEQLLPRIPAQEHDVDVDIVVTPTRVIRAADHPCS